MPARPPAAERGVPAGFFVLADQLPQGKIACVFLVVLVRVDALAAARERGLKVIPICPFFAAYMQEHADVQDLLEPAWRKQFGLKD